MVLRAARFTARSVGQQPAPCKCVLFSTSRSVRSDFRRLGSSGSKNGLSNTRFVTWLTTLSPLLSRSNLACLRDAVVVAVDWSRRLPPSVRNFFLSCDLQRIPTHPHLLARARRSTQTIKKKRQNKINKRNLAHTERAHHHLRCLDQGCQDFRRHRKGGLEHKSCSETCDAPRVQGSGFRVQGSGFRVQGARFRVLGFRAKGLSN